MSSESEFVAIAEKIVEAKGSLAEVSKVVKRNIETVIENKMKSNLKSVNCSISSKSVTTKN